MLLTRYGLHSSLKALVFIKEVKLGQFILAKELYSWIPLLLEILKGGYKIDI